jgi:signal recognition particle subunit SEC65
MVFLTLAEAARLTGKNASTITRAVQKGKVSCQVDVNGQRVFDPSELERAFGKLKNVEESESACTNVSALECVSLHDEIKRLHEQEIALVQKQVQIMQTQIEDLKNDRDHWRQQATYLLEDKRMTEQEQKELDLATTSITKAEEKLERIRSSWLGRLFFNV